MRKLMILFLSFFSVMVLAQTKLIAHRSHSGSNANFREMLDNDLFDVSDSNFGAAPQRLVKNATLDTVIYISAEKAIMVTSEYCSYVDRFEEQNAKEKFSRSLWKKGKDTVIEHPLFSRSHSLDSIKDILRQQYYFKNNIDSVVFIGFDNKVKKYKKESRKKKKSVMPLIIKNINFPSGIISCSIVILMGIATFMIWKVKTLERFLLHEE